MTPIKKLIVRSHKRVSLGAMRLALLRLMSGIRMLEGNINNHHCQGKLYDFIREFSRMQ